MTLRKSLIAGAALGLCGFSLAPISAFAQAGAPFNSLDHVYRSLEEFRDEVRAQAGYHKPEWVCQQPAGPCVWKPGYWGPPPPRPGGAYVYVRPLGDVGLGGYYPLD